MRIFSWDVVHKRARPICAPDDGPSPVVVAAKTPSATAINARPLDMD